MKISKLLEAITSITASGYSLKIEPTSGFEVSVSLTKEWQKISKSLYILDLEGHWPSSPDSQFALFLEKLLKEAQEERGV